MLVLAKLLVTIMMASANPYNNNENIKKIKVINTYLGDAIKHDS